MALKFQFNKTAMQSLKKDLKVRERALPTLKAKETALRMEVKRAKVELKEAETAFKKHKKTMLSYSDLWDEFPQGFLTVKDVDLAFKKIAGVKIPILNKVIFSIEKSVLFGLPAWVGSGTETLKEAAELNIKIDVAQKRVTVLDYARRKTTQKVNLYEKVQIPELHEALLKIKRFLEDQENLEKSSQKILKTKISQAEALADLESEVAA